MIPQRQILWNVPPSVMAGVYVLSTLAAGWIIFWFCRRGRIWSKGAPDREPIAWRDGLGRLSRYLATHRTVRRDPYAGAMHQLLFWGFLILLIATTLVGIQDHSGIEFLRGTTYLVFKFVSNLGGVCFGAGLIMALWRRRRSGAARLSRSGAVSLLLWGMLLLTLDGFLVEGARIAVALPPFEKWSFGGYAVAQILNLAGIAGGRAVPLHRLLWISHAALAIVFFVVIPISLLKHLFLGSYSILRPVREPGQLIPPPQPVLGKAGLSQFWQSDLIQADACLACGRCAEACPAEAAGKPLSPRGVVLGLREMLEQPDGTAAVADAALWSCTSCHACDAACPIHIRVLDKIVALRRARVAEGEIPDSLALALEASAQKFNPFGQPNSARTEWAAGLGLNVARDDEPVELLYWVGCAGSFDPAGREVSRAVLAILKHLKVNYRVLGCRERCSGDPARRSGEEGLWRELAAGNQARFAAHGVRTILTQCPHCFNAFRNEYPEIGPMPQVIHHSQWLRDQLGAGKLRLRPGAQEKIAFHDPCYLSRANHETEAPREVLAGLARSSRVEMERHGEKSFCCGGGGGQLWLDVRGRTRVETLRAAEAEKTGADTVATGCPFCRVMLEAGRSSLPAGQGKWRVKDLAEIVAENLEPEKTG